MAPPNFFSQLVTAFEIVNLRFWFQLVERVVGSCLAYAVTPIFFNTESYDPRTMEKLNFWLFSSKFLTFLKKCPPESEILVSMKRERAHCINSNDSMFLTQKNYGLQKSQRFDF